MKCFLPKLLFSFIVLFLCCVGVNAQHGLKAEYYNGVNFDKVVAVKFVDNIDDSWDNTPPVAGLNPHECSIRWTGKLIPGKSGNYLFSARVDDGIRVWLDDKLIINQWELNDVGIFENSIELFAGETYTLKVEYFNALLEGEVRLLWQIPGIEKEESWFEYFFGNDDPYYAIESDYLFHPDNEELYTEAEVESNVERQNPPSENTSLPKQPKSAPTAKPTPVAKEQKQAAKTAVTSVEAEKFIPKNIGFERAKTTILSSSIPELNIFAQFMLDNPELSVQIEGHTDPVGDETLNLKLSKNRAYKIANFLAKKGIHRDRISAEGFGGSRPLNVPKKGEYHPANRRVVFILSGFE